MIDTDKYEGHTPACDWEIHLADALFETEFPMTYADNQLMADAPLLLAEVKRLREEKELFRQGIIDGTLMHPNLYNYLPLYLRELIE